MQGGRLARLRESRPTATASYGCISPIMTGAVSSRRRTCSTAASTPTAFAAGWCWSAPRRSGSSTSRPRRSSRRCRASRSTPSSSRACSTKTVLTSPSYATLAELALAALVGLADHRARAAAWRLGAVLGRRRHGGAPRRRLLVLLRAAQSADRLHLSADCELADLPDARLHQLSPRPVGAARRSAPPSASISRRCSSSSSPNRRRSSCSAARSGS